MKWLWRAFALFFAIFGASSAIVLLVELVSGTSDPNPMALPLGALFLVVGIGMAIYAFTASVSFTQSTVEHRTIFSRKELPLDEIKGRREVVDKGKGGNTRYLRLVPGDDQLSTLEFSKNYTFDDAFYRWFYSLPDLDAKDKEVHKDSNFGLV
jgi:hypothetical protein